MDDKVTRKYFFLVFALSLLVLCCSQPLLAATPETSRVHLDADKISFEESSGIATAEGNVRITNTDFRLFAPYVEYDSDQQQIKALSSPEGTVSLLSAGKRINGERLDYNIGTQRGVLTSPNGKVEAFYVKGDAIEVLPLSEISGRKSSKTDDAEDMAGIWTEPSLTTCGNPNPHYRLEAKELTVIPGKRLVIRKPKVYLGKQLLFSYPFDYMLPLGKRTKHDKAMLFPKIGYESNKGGGLGVSGPFVWNTGSLNLEAIAWTGGIWEGEAALEQEISPGLRAYGRINREYDKDNDLTLWRPSWGFTYEQSGWQLEAGWSQRELLTLEKKAGKDYRYVVWRKPEVNIISPWFTDAATAGQFRLLGTWGRYEDATRGSAPTVERAGAGAQLYGEFGGSRDDFQPFYNAYYWYYHYDSDISDKQQILDTVLGARWKLGEVDMETAYLRRWSWGYSPMEWDNYDKREEIYQQVRFKLPTPSKQEWWELGVRAAYSLDEEELAEMVYQIAYDQHCLRWELVYRDDKSGDDSWVGLKLTIKAYPESGVRLAGNELFDPAKAPDELAPNLY